MQPHFRSHTLRGKRSSRNSSGSRIIKPAIPDIIDFCEDRLGFTPDPRQRAVLTSTSKRVILNCTRQWGKSTVSASKAVHVAYTVPKSLIVVATPCLRQSNEWMIRAEDMVTRLGIEPRTDGVNDVSLLLPNGSRIVGLPEGDAKLRGFSSVSMLIVDEAARVPDRTYYESLRAMLLVSNGDIWMLSTPCGQTGFFYKTWISPDPRWLRVSVQADQCPRISHDFLAEQRAEMTSDAFRQEHMCEFTTSENAWFNPATVYAALDDAVLPI